MRRTTITLPDEVFEAVERAARRGRTSVSEVIRTMLAAQLGKMAAGERPLPFADLGRSGQRHVARNMEALLTESLET
jgi:metal-responsive CopG/Arc/MetJ family transcriptional regulator